MRGKRILELDGLRGLAVLGVIAFHYISVSIPQTAHGGLAVLRKIFSYGWTGVDLFFVLSGFLISGILMDHQKSQNYYRAFYLRRFARIFPLYYSLLFIFITLKYVSSGQGGLSEAGFESPIQIQYFFLFLQNFSIVNQGTFGNEYLAVTWSLAIEEQFYLFLPLLIRKSAREKLPINFLFCIFIALGLRYITPGGLADHVLTLWRLDSLFAGALLAYVLRTPPLAQFFHRHYAIVRGLFAIQLVYFIFIVLIGDVGVLGNYGFYALFFTTLIFIVLEEKDRWPVMLLRNRVLRHLGLISFSMYLFHQLINGLLHDIFLQSLPDFSSPASMIVTAFAFTLCVVWATLTYHLMEKHFIRLGHKVPYDNSH